MHLSFSKLFKPVQTDSHSVYGEAWTDIKEASARDPEKTVLELYDAHRRDLLIYALSLGAAPQDVEDLAQEAFLRLHAELLGGMTHPQLRPWLFKVLHNLVVSAGRTNSRQAMLVTDSEWETILSRLQDDSLSPESALLETEARLRVGQRMQLLSPAQHHCLQLRIDGFRYQEIAEVLGVSISTVATSVRRAVEKLSEKEQ